MGSKQGIEYNNRRRLQTELRERLLPKKERVQECSLSAAATSRRVWSLVSSELGARRVVGAVLTTRTWLRLRRTLRGPISWHVGDVLELRVSWHWSGRGVRGGRCRLIHVVHRRL